MEPYQRVFRDEDSSFNRDESSLQMPSFEGFIDKVLYFQEESGRCVLEVKTEDRASLLVAGRLPEAFPGQRLEVYGASTSVSRPEEILTAKKLVALLPDAPRTLRKFLKSGAIKGLGPKLATRIAGAASPWFFQALEQSPSELLKIKGIGPKTVESIVLNWQSYQALTKIREFLFQENLPLFWSAALWARFGVKSLDQLKTFPYETAQSLLFDFESIDSFGLRLHVPLESPDRIRCALYDTLRSFMKQGHCAIPESLLVEQTSARLEIDSEIADWIYEAEVIRGELVSDQVMDTSCCFLKEIWQLEQQVAEELIHVSSRPVPWGEFHLDKVLPWAQSLLKIQLAPLQIEAIKTALSSPLTVITGGPGTGKTTLIRTFLTILQTQFVSFALCSPTGRASQRLTETTGSPAQTLHRLLKYDPLTGTFQKNQLNPLEYDLVVIDEASMIDLELMSALIKAMPRHGALILVGDADQIPSIGLGHVLQSILDCGVFKKVRLEEIFRQQKQSAILVNAERIKKGLMPLSHDQLDPEVSRDFQYFSVVGVERTTRVLHDLLVQKIPQDLSIQEPSSIQILVPMNKGPLGSH